MEEKEPTIKEELLKIEGEFKALETIQNLLYDTLKQSWKDGEAAKETNDKWRQSKDKTLKHYFILVIILIFCFVGSNLAWLYAFTQYEFSTTTTSVDSKDGGNANFIGGSGSITNGEDSSNGKKSNP